MSKVSVIIPSRNERFLPETVDDIFNHARGDFEVIVILDEKDQPIKPRDGLHVHKKIGSPGLRSAVNQGVAASKGKFIMKLDAHCKLDEGFDVKLAKYCEDNWIVIPRRYSLSAKRWSRKMDRPIIDYEYVVFPFVKELTSVRLGGKWYERAEARKELLLDENMTFQGSTYFMTKKHWKNIGGFDADPSILHGDEFVLESEDLSFKTWLTGGKVMVNKRTWYAHLHKGNRYGRGYFLSSSRIKKHRLAHIDYWFHDKWPGAKYKMEWFVEKFMLIPGWPEDWQDPKYEREFMETNK